MAPETLPYPPLGVAVIGCGRISASHLEAIAAQPNIARLIAVADADLARAQATAGRFDAPHAFADLAEVFAVDAVEAVIICTPNDLHPAQSLAALNAGRHVLVEKPMAESLKDASAMRAAADQRGLILALGMALRHTAPIRYLQDHRDDFGALRAVEVTQCVFWDGPQAPWWATRTPEQGLILSLFAPHALDFVQLVMGEDPLSIQAVAARHQSGWVGEDEAMVLLGYPGQRLASIHLSYNQRRIVDRKTLYFEGAALRIEDGDNLWIDDRLVVAPAAPPPGDPRAMGGRDLSSYFRTQLAEFVAAVRGEPHRSVLQAEGERLTTLTEAVIQAALRTGG